MRIGTIIPSLNGVGVGRIGDDSRILANLASDVAAYAYTGMTQPQQVAAILADLEGMCGQLTNFNAVAGGTDTCPVNLEQLVTQAVAAAAPAVAVVAPPPATAQMQYSSQPANALDRVTPQTSSVRGPGPVSNALAPPVNPVPVVNTNAGTFTGTQATAAPAGSTQQTAPVAPSASFFDQTVSIGSVNIPTWVLIAGAGVGLFLMTKGKR